MPTRGAGCLGPNAKSSLTVLTTPIPEPPDWGYVRGLLLALWGDAKEGTPYSREQKRKWARLLEAVEYMARRGGERSSFEPHR